LLVGVVPVAAVVRCLEGSQAFGAEVVHWPPGWEGSGLAEWACAAMVAREGSVWSIATLDGSDYFILPNVAYDEYYSGDEHLEALMLMVGLLETRASAPVVGGGGECPLSHMHSALACWCGSEALVASRIDAGWVDAELSRFAAFSDPMFSYEDRILREI
jgi:hypothetical protein